MSHTKKEIASKMKGHYGYKLGKTHHFHLGPEKSDGKKSNPIMRALTSGIYKNRPSDWVEKTNPKK